jgi:nucleoside-diphosphate-sugar epimerase
MIFVLGCDGYIGNALTQKLLAEGKEVIGFDNFWRRDWVRDQMNSFSATPLLEMEEKAAIFREMYRGTFSFEELDIEYESDVERLKHMFEDFKPDVVINLAHNPSGPYSMKSRMFASEVLSNNILGTNNLLWNIKDIVPDCHYITIGTAGEYDHYCNIDIEEGYSRFKHKGRMSNEVIFPRRPGSIYHTSKTASTYLIDYLARAWNLKCTDVMQGIVFGTYTDEIAESNIYSRFDTDEAGGTVINRFVLQAILGIPLTIYGQGEHQRTFLSLNDSVQALMLAVNNPAEKGRVQTWNQLSEWHSMNEIANMVCEVASDNFGLLVDKQWIDTPRMEHTGSHYYHYVTDNLKALGYKPTRNVKFEILHMFETLLPMKDELFPLEAVIEPKIKFTKE